MNPKDVPSGGPAFPVPNEWEKHWEGMTLRDYFAAHAPGAPDDFAWAPGEVDSWERRARWSYVYADTMLAAREAA